jgi:Uncharacterized protein conserved in bacteria (DUF2188)
MSKRPDIHVFADSVHYRWDVAQGGRTLSHHRTQMAAVDAGKRRARRDQVDLATHARDGRIRSKDSYGNESPARDTER